MGILLNKIKKNKGYYSLYLLGLMFIFPIIKFLSITKQYLYVDYFEVFFRTTGDIVALSFPLLLLLAYPLFFTERRNHHFLNALALRLDIQNYLKKSYLQSLVTGFLFSFTFIFVTYFFVVFLVPHLGLITLYPQEFRTYHTPFYFMLENKQIFRYGLFYATWVGINGALYAGLNQLSIIYFEKKILGVFFTTFFFIGLSFAFQLFDGLSHYGPMMSIFPFSTTKDLSMMEMLIGLIPVTVCNLIFYYLGIERLCKHDLKL